MNPVQYPEDAKKFSLKPNESELIRGEMARHNTSLASILSFISVERLAYPVGQLTAFTLENDLAQLVIWENPSDEAPVQGKPVETETAKALKKK